MVFSRFIFACSSLLFLVFSQQLFAAQCSAVFPDVIATHGNGVGNSQINFGYNAHLLNNPDTELSTRRVNHNSGSNINSCGSANCSATNASAETSTINFRQGGGSESFFVGYQGTHTFGSTNTNAFDQISANSEVTLNFSDNYDVYFFERLALGFNNTLNLAAGKTYYLNSFSMGSSNKINVIGSGTAIVYVNSSVNFSSSSMINSIGENVSGDTSKLVMHINGNVTFSSRSTYSGALYANDLNFNSPSYLYGVASGQKVTLASNSILTYDNNVFNADFGEVCDTGANNVTAIANFKFDETQYNDIAGEVKDSIGTFDSQAKLAQPVDGKVCRAIDLSSSGIEDYVVLDKNVLNGKREFSVSLWAKTAKTSNQSFLSGATSNSFNELIMWFNDHTTFTPHLQNSANGSVTNSSIADNTWRHLVWTHGNNKSCLFIDKAPQGCITQTTRTLDIESLILGQEQDSVGGRFSSAQAFDGLLDELVVFDQVIEQSQIDEIYDFQNNGLDLDGGPIVCPEIPPVEFAEPIANFKFDEKVYSDIAEEVKDSIGSFHSQAKIAQPVEGKVCRAVDLSTTGTDDYVVLDKDLLNNKREFSVSLWEKTAKTSNQSVLSGATSGSNNELIMWFNSDKQFTPHLQNRANGTLTTSSIAGDTWRHIVWTHGQNKSCLFINKVEQGCVSQATSTLTIESLILGQEQDIVGGRFDANQAFNGLIDELVIFDKPIGQEQIDQIYDYQNNGLGLNGETIMCDNELIAHYAMEETSWQNTAAEVVDETGNFNAQGSAGATTDNATPALTGNPGTCRYGTFDGVDDYIELPDTFDNLQDSFTVTAWVNPSNLNSGSRIFIDDENNQNGFGFSLGDPGNGRLRFFSRGVSPISVDTTSSITANTWTFVTAVHNSVTKTRQIYINGVAQTLSGGGTSNAYTGDWGVDSGPASIGGETSNSGEQGSRFHFTGAIDEVHVFKGALSSDEINEVYAKRHACAEPVIHHYEIEHDGYGLTCEVEPITIKACTNSDCSSISTESVSLDFTATSAITGTEIKHTPTFTGSTSFNFGHTVAEPLTLSINGATVVAANPVECIGAGASCEMVFDTAQLKFIYNGTSVIDHQTAGVLFGADLGTAKLLQLQALKDNNGVCQGIFNGNVNISLAQENIQPNSSYNAGLAFQTNSQSIAKHPAVTNNVMLNFNNNSVATITNPRYLDVGKIRLHASFSNSEISLNALSNEFWVKPDHLDITASKASGLLLNGSGAESTTIHQAGEHFTFKVEAKNSLGNNVQNFRQDDGAIELKATRIAPILGGSVDGVFNYNLDDDTLLTSAGFQPASLEAFGTTGTSNFSQAKYNEVGIIELDVQVPDYGNIGTNSLTVDAVAKTVGRFTPSYFTQAVVNHGNLDAFHSNLPSACMLENWAYTGQKTASNNGNISYGSEPIISISAHNADGDLTQNYTLGDSEGFMKLVKSGVKITLPTKDSEQLKADNVAGNFVALNAFMEQDSAVLSASTDASNNLVPGVWRYTFSPDDHFSYIRDNTSFQKPFAAKIPFIVNEIEDSDGIVIGSVIDARENVITPGVEIKFGRLMLENSFGSENAVLRPQMFVQVYNGTSFVQHDVESCLTPLINDKKSGDKYSGGMSLWDYRLIDLATDAVAPSDTSASIAAMFNAGKHQGLQFLAPGKQGVLDFEYQVPSWLQFDWLNEDGLSDGPFDVNPSATLNFGIYRGNDRIISWREVTN